MLLCCVIYAKCPVCWVSKTSPYAQCRYAECHYAECHYVECLGAINNNSTIMNSMTNFIKLSRLRFKLLWPGKSNWRGRLSTADLLVLTSLDYLIFYNENTIYLFTRQAALMRRSFVLSLPPSVSIPRSDNHFRPSLTFAGKTGASPTHTLHRMDTCQD
jgi:hypothetical protein